LARGHVRSGDAVAIKGYIGNTERMARSIAKFAQHYAEVTNDDFEVFKKAIKAGKVKVASGPTAK
jgi:hypothetical protein